MAKYKRYDYSQSVLIPVSLQEQLVPGTLEFAIHTLVDRRMDMTVFDDNYQNDETGRSAYDPKILLKVVLLAYSRGLTSSRQIERACCENVLLNGPAVRMFCLWRCRVTRDLIIAPLHHLFLR